MKFFSKFRIKCVIFLTTIIQLLFFMYKNYTPKQESNDNFRNFFFKKNRISYRNQDAEFYLKIGKNKDYFSKCLSRKKLIMDKLLKISYLNSSVFNQSNTFYKEPKYKTDKQHYLIAFNSNYFKEYFNLNASYIECSVQLLDKYKNAAEVISFFDEKKKISANNNYELVTSRHGFYFFECYADHKLKIRTVFTVFPHNMSILIDESITEQQKITELKSLYESPELDSFLNDVDYKECGDFSNEVKSKNKKMNVLIIGIDSVSQNHLQRVFPKTFEYLNNLKNNVFFENYNKIGEGTYPNIAGAFLSGLFTYSNVDAEIQPEIDIFRNLDSTFHDLFPLIWKEYEKINYLTMYNEDQFQNSIFAAMKKGFRYKPCSFYTIPLFMVYNGLGFDFKKCHYNEPMYEKELNDLKMFIDQMNTQTNINQPYFSFNFYKLYSHDHFYLPPEYDIKLKETLEYFDQMNYLKNTLLIVMSDHGFRLGGYSSNSEDGLMERNMPFLSMKLPESLIGTEFGKNVLKNKLKLFTPFDVYKTLKQFYYINRFGIDSISSSKECREHFQTTDVKIRHRRGISLFENIPTNRSCFDAHIPNIFCSDIENTKIGSFEFREETDYSIFHAGKLIEERLNRITEQRRSICKPFKLFSIKSIVKMKTYTHKFYRLHVIFKPDNAVFEGFIILENKQLKNYGTLIRLDIYSGQSKCVKEIFLKGFCYCTGLK